VIPLAACESGVVLSEAPGTATDPRGCGCPYSPCNFIGDDNANRIGVCVGQCTARAFRLVGPIEGVAVANRQEALNGATPDGARLLYLAGERCNLDNLYVADRTEGGYTSTDLTPQLVGQDVHLREGCCTLDRDGRGIIIERASTGGLLYFPLDGTRLGKPDPSPFAQIFVAGPKERAYMPVLSADRRTLYFRVNGTPDHSGIYEAKRASTSEPFGVGTKLTGRATTYEYVSSVSDDERTMFMAAEYATRVLVRSGPEEIYSDLSPTIMPSRLPGWRAIPIDGCRRLITTITPGGCESEQTVFFEAVGM
jgi:hypothetical protein